MHASQAFAATPNLKHNAAVAAVNQSGFQDSKVVKGCAKVLGVDEASVTKELKKGKTLSQLATEKGLKKDAFLQKLKNAVATSIDADVTAGAMTKAQADQQKNILPDHLKKQIDNASFGSTLVKNDPTLVQPQNNNTVATVVNTNNENNGLIDINNHWAVKSIKDLVAKGILQGDQNKRFNPDSTVTREALAAMLSRSFNLHADTSAAPSISDVPQDRWSYKNIAATKEFFDMKKDPQGNESFNPTAGAKREDVVVSMVKVLIKKKPSVTLMNAVSADNLLKEKFKDEGSIPVELRPYVATAVQCNLIQGDAQGHFAPTHTITRAETATLLDRMLSSNTVK
ncbi:hypothetical protein Back11_10880 [Paenibacillus baekrokdamisoli]|uniref:SLH domain-containing protein n=2 Tax=Paenibacillus baekrokdamisoli TaxID=1712516 RepID=A0A3G9J4T2_9BACL|nr:hypothetical protein Back11_10880 [Paenibacillus baekrokdamisoli]